MNDKPLHVCIIGAGFDTQNLGVDVLATGLVRCIRHAGKNYRISLLDYAKRPAVYHCRLSDETVPVDLVNMRFSIKIFQKTNIVILLFLAGICRALPGGRLERFIMKSNRCFKAISSATIIGSIAGGDSFSDIYGMVRLLYVTLPQVLVILLKKPLVQFPQTFGPFNSPLARILARFILKHSTKVFSRDRSGVEFIKKMAPVYFSSRCGFAYDVGFTLEPIVPEGDKKLLELLRADTPIKVGFNISGLLYRGEGLHADPFHFKSEYRLTCQNIIEYLLSNDGITVLLVPHVLGRDPNGESDTIACMRVQSAFQQKYPGRVFAIDRDYTAGETKYIISGCDFFIGSRMHACIAALSTNVPAAALAYSDKFIGVFDSIGFRHLVVNPKTSDSMEIVASIDRLFHDRAAIREALSHTIPAIASDSLQLIKKIVKDL